MGVSRIVRVGTPYNGVDLDEIDFEQQADTMYLAHLDYPVTKLTRSAHDGWAFSTVAFGPSLSAPGSLSVTAYVPNTDSENGGNAYYPRAAHYTVTALDENGVESRADTPVQAINDLDLKRNYNCLLYTSPSPRDS